MIVIVMLCFTSTQQSQNETTRTVKTASHSVKKVARRDRENPTHCVVFVTSSPGSVEARTTDGPAGEGFGEMCGIEFMVKEFRIYVKFILHLR